jgi:hypothetical protein
MNRKLCKLARNSHGIDSTVYGICDVACEGSGGVQQCCVDGTAATSSPRLTYHTPSYKCRGPGSKPTCHAIRGAP